MTAHRQAVLLGEGEQGVGWPVVLVTALDLRGIPLHLVLADQAAEAIEDELPVMPASLAAVGERGVGDGRAKEEGVALEPIPDTSIADRRSVPAAQFDDEVALADALDAAVGVAAPVVGVLGPGRRSEGVGAGGSWSRPQGGR